MPPPPVSARPSMPPPPVSPPTFHGAPTLPPPPAAWQTNQPPAAARQAGPVAPAAAGPTYPTFAPTGTTAPPYRFELRRLTPIDQFTAAAAVILLVVLFVPWFHGNGCEYSLGGINAHSYLAFAVLTSVTLITYLAMRAGWDRLPFPFPIAHAPLLLVVGVLQFLIVLVAFLSIPSVPGALDRTAGAYIGLVAAIGALLPIAIPAMQATQRHR